jgi:glycosyltransferase involved in cell wall biosynthesis/ribosomal protein S18 acetylase RimI-like enzyme
VGAVVSRHRAVSREPERFRQRPVRVAHVTTIDLTLRFLVLEQLRRLRDEGYEVTAVSAPGEWVDEIRGDGIEHVAWHNATRAWNPAADLRAFTELLGIVRRGRFDVVHTHNPKPGLMGRLAARIAGVPVVVNTVHGFWATPDDPPRKRLPVMALEWVAARLSHAELYQSSEDLAWARRLRIGRPSRAHHLGNGTDLTEFDPTAVDPARLESLRRELGIGPGDRVVGMVGRLVREKGYGEFFHAARTIRARHPDVVFLAVGPSDPDKDDDLTASDRDAAGSDVVFTGYRADVRDLLALMDVFVLPSWREGMPRSAIEAAAMGRAMVLTDIRGCREVARDGVEALLVPPRDADRLTSAIERLLEDDDLRARMSAAAFARARERFDERAVAARVAEVYRQLLPPRRRPPRRVELDGLHDVVIRPAGRADVPAIAAMHAAVMTKAFLPMLGEPFLRQLFRALVDDPTTPTLVADRGGEVIGYTSGAVSMRAFRRRFVLRRGIPAVIAAAPRLLRPGVLRRAYELFRYPEQTEGLPDAEHTLIGVKPRTAPGLGMALTIEALEALEDLGVEEIKCYVAADNLTMRRVVRRAGFEPRGEITLHDGVPSYVCVYRCRSSSPSVSVSS